MLHIRCLCTVHAWHFLWSHLHTYIHRAFIKRHFIKITLALSWKRGALCESDRVYSLIVPLGADFLSWWWKFLKDNIIAKYLTVLCSKHSHFHSTCYICHHSTKVKKWSLKSAVMLHSVVKICLGHIITMRHEKNKRDGPRQSFVNVTPNHFSVAKSNLPGHGK